ncbi:MAG TPA: alpha/beta hydrolase [Rhodanobacteraceae bacterium]
MNKLMLAGVLAAALVSGVVMAGAPAKPAAVSDCGLALPTGGQTFTVGTLHVIKYGDHGRPVILIPGLTSGPWEWARTIRDLRGNHVVYAVTLAGFDGVPMPKRKTHLLDQADASLLQLIQSRHIDHPVLVGHSIGGTLALRFAGEHNELLGGVVAVDGLPVFPGAQDLTPAQRKARAAMLKARMGGMSPAEEAAYDVRYMQNIGVNDKVKAVCYAKLTARSDPAASAEYAADDYASDFRPGLKNVTVPVLEIVPYSKAMAAMMSKRSGKQMTAAAKKAFYAGLLDNAKTAKVEMIQDARHFVMLDQPVAFKHALDGFLAQLPQH